MNRLRRLDDLLELFGSSSNVEAPVDTNSFGRKAGELISRGATAQMPGQTQPMSSLDVIDHSPSSDRLTLIVAAGASASLLVGGDVVGVALLA
jgi:hypothetical protein